MATGENQENKFPEEEQPIIPDSFNHLLSLRGSNAPRKTNWPELVGLTAEEAESKIKEEMPDARIQVIPPDNFVTCDYRLDRVRLYVGASGKVERVPKLG